MKFLIVAALAATGLVTVSAVKTGDLCDCLKKQYEKKDAKGNSGITSCNDDAEMDNGKLIVELGQLANNCIKGKSADPFPEADNLDKSKVKNSGTTFSGKSAKVRCAAAYTKYTTTGYDSCKLVDGEVTLDTIVAIAKDSIDAFKAADAPAVADP